MTPMRWLYAAFWIFIGTVLFIQFTNYNSKLEKPEVKRSQQTHFYYPPTHQLGPVVAPVFKPDAADVQQIGHSVDQDTPSQGSFTYHVTLKNQGKKKAVAVEVVVYPYRGIIMGDPDGGRGGIHHISDNDPYAQTSQSVSFPDLAPGESATRDAVFLSVPGHNPGGNPNPEIVFHTEK